MIRDLYYDLRGTLWHLMGVINPSLGTDPKLQPHCLGNLPGGTLSEILAQKAWRPELLTQTSVGTVVLYPYFSLKRQGPAAGLKRKH